MFERKLNSENIHKNNKYTSRSGQLIAYLPKNPL